MVPLASAQSGGSGATGSEESGPGEGDRVRAGDAILRSGDTGSAVVAVQQKLAVDADGVFGPVTEDAVEDFQGRVGLSVTGEVDSRTWTELFRAAVSFVPEGSPEAKAIQASVSGDTEAEAEAEPAEPEAEAEPAEPEAEARATTAVAPDDDAEPAPPRDTAPSDDVEADDTDDAADDTQGDDSDADDAEEPDAPEGGARPEAGVELSSEVPNPSIEADDEVAVTGDGNCATGVMGTPVAGTVTGTFGEDRGSHRHGGLDIAAPSGTAVRAALCGTVTQAGAQGAYGNLICIRHTSEFSTCYAHLSSFETRAGEYVRVGEVIGRVGSTGRSTGPHLHFETRINGRAHDPEPYLDGERRVPGTSTGGGEARAQRASASSSASSESGSGETRTASAQESQSTATGGGTPPNGVAEQESDEAHDPRGYEFESSQQQSVATSQSEPQQAPAPEQPAQTQAAPAQEPAPAPEQSTAQEQAPAPEQAPAQEQVPAEEPAPAEVAVTQAVEVAPETEVTTEAPAEEQAPADPVEETVAPVVEETPAAPVVEETPAAPVVEEAAAPVAEAAAPVTDAVAPTPAG